MASDEADAATSDADLRRRPARLAVGASALAFGDTAVGDNVSHPVTITNVGRRGLVITAVDIDGAAFSAPGLVLPATLAPGQSADLTISFAPAVAGPASAQIVISSNDASSPAILTASANGVAVLETVPVPTPAPIEAPPTPTPDPAIEAPVAAPVETPPAPAPAPAPVPAPVPAPAPAPDAGSTLSWTKPAGFDGALQSAISQQPAYMGGYGGQVSNPFPRLDGTVKFSGMQITRPDAIILGNHFGRPSFRFYVDAQSRHSNGLRAEFTGAAEFQFKAGDTYNYQFSTYFPTEYKNSTWEEWNLFAQFHGPGFPAWGLHTAGGYLHMKAPGAAANAYRIPMPSRGQWHDFSWTIHWAPDASGYATLSVDGVAVFNFRGVTMEPSEPYYYPKFGSYLANNPYTQVTYSTPWVVSRL